MLFFRRFPAVCRLLPGMLLFVMMPGHTADWRDLAWDDLRQNYGWFTETLQHQGWESISSYITDMTIINNDEQGMDGMKRAFADDRCRKAVIRALELGCRRSATGTGEGELLLCSAPPQQGSEIIYAGASAQFWYHREREQWELRYVNCGGI